MGRMGGWEVRRRLHVGVSCWHETIIALMFGCKRRVQKKQGTCRCEHKSLLTHDTVAVAVIHIRIGRMVATDRSYPVLSSLRTSDPPVAIVIPQCKRIHGGTRFGCWSGCGSWSCRRRRGRSSSRCRRGIGPCHRSNRCGRGNRSCRGGAAYPLAQAEVLSSPRRHLVSGERPRPHKPRCDKHERCPQNNCHDEP